MEVKIMGRIRTTTGIVGQPPSAWIQKSDEVGEFNLLAFNAKGDDVTDDRGAFADAVAACTHGCIHVPPGTFRISSNITISSDIKFSKHAVLSIDTGVTVTLTGNLEAPLHQIFTGLGAVSFTGNTKISTFLPEWWGALGDDSHDDSDAIQYAIDSAYAAGGSVFFHPVTYKTTTTVGITLDSDKITPFPSLVGVLSSSVSQYDITYYNGVARGSIIKYYGTGTAVKFAGTGPTQSFAGGTIRDLTIMNNSAGHPADSTIGLHLAWCLEHRLYNVGFLGFNVGYLNEASFSSDEYGLTAMHNVYGIRCTDNWNAVGIFGAQLHQNTYGIEIRSGMGSTIKRATIESNSIGIIIDSQAGDPTPAPTTITLDDIYSESCHDTDIVIGASIAKVVSANQIKNIKIRNYTTSGTPGDPDYFIWLDNVKNVEISDVPYGQIDAVRTTANTYRVKLPAATSNYSFSGRSQYDSEKNQIALEYPFNLIANGFTRLPSLQQNWIHPFIPKTTYGTTVSGWFEYAIVDGMNVWKIRAGDPQVASQYIHYQLRTTDKLWGRTIVVNARCKRDADITVSLGAYNAAGGAITTNGSKTVGTDWGNNYMYFIVPASGDYIDIAFIVVNTGGAGKHFYVESIVAALDGQGQIQRSPLDYLQGLSGITKGSIAGKTVTLDNRFKIGNYGVTCTPQANGMAWVTIDDDAFVLYTTVDSLPVLWTIVPLVGIL